MFNCEYLKTLVTFEGSSQVDSKCDTRVKIEGYSVMYFDRIAAFEAIAELPLRAGLMCTS